MKVIRYTADRIEEDPPTALADLPAQPDGVLWVDLLVHPVRACCRFSPSK